MDDLLNLVAELKEVVEGLRSIRVSDEIDWWNQALVSLRQEQQAEKKTP